MLDLSPVVRSSCKQGLGYAFSPYSLPKYMLLDLPHDVIRSVAQLRLRVYTLRYETATWNHRSSLNCDLYEVDDDVQDEQHVLFHCKKKRKLRRQKKLSLHQLRNIAHIPRWSLSAGNMPP
eukprot:409120-Pelagomonas_calceolata.AAC.1